MTTTPTIQVQVGDKVRFQFLYSTGEQVTFRTTCYAVYANGTCGLRIPGKVMSLRFCPYPSNRMLFRNAFHPSIVTR